MVVRLLFEPLRSSTIENSVTDAALAGSLHDSIVATGLTKSYAPYAPYGASTALGARIDRGAPWPNGAGKTTTIDMLIGLARPDAGTVSLFRSHALPGGQGRHYRRDDPKRAAH